MNVVVLRSRRFVGAWVASMMVIALAVILLATHDRREHYDPFSAPRAGDRVSEDTYFDYLTQTGAGQERQTAPAITSGDSITTLGVRLPLRDVDLGPNRWIEVEDRLDMAYRYEQGAKPSAQRGVTSVYFHRDHGVGDDYRLSPLTDLTEAETGTRITLTHGGEPSTYEVTDIETVTGAMLPSAVTTTTGPHRLALVTCGGGLTYTTRGTWTWSGRVIVWATPITANPADTDTPTSP